MSNNKQSSLEWFAQKLYETLEIRGDGYVIDSLLDLAKAMHKEETLKLYNEYEDYLDDEFKNQLGGQSVIKSFEQYYNETFGDNNEKL
jgi:hypothetical protein